MTAAAPTLALRPEPRLLAGLDDRRALDLDEHYRHYGRLEPRNGSLLMELEASGLTGRGGAGFPTAAKLRAVAGGGRRPVVVVNAAEGEPLSRKDSLLTRRLPHLVIDGAVALAASIGARDIVFVHATHATQEADSLRTALAARGHAKLDGRIALRTASVPDGFVSGQETAIVQFLNGGPALPTFSPPRPFESGVAGRPTLVQNAETAAHVALIARHGAGWFRQQGTAQHPGSMLFTVSGAVARPGVYEAPLGTQLKAILATAGGLTSPPKAFLVGGYAGGWIDAPSATQLALDETSLRSHGLGLGVGAIFAFPDHACGLCQTARVARYLANESAAQCGPCIHGLDAIASRLERPGRQGPVADRAALTRWAAQVTGRGACRHPDGTARFVASALTVFRDELNEGHDPTNCRPGRVTLLPIPTSDEP